MNIFLDANICLDLLDTTRPTARAATQWYMEHKDDESLVFYFSGDFITTFYYILTERNKIDGCEVVEAIEALSMEVLPFYINHTDFIDAKSSFYAGVFDDFEDLIALHSALRAECEVFLTSDMKLLRLGEFGTMKITNVS